MATFVLVHGAWHGGWCYARVAKILRARGHEVFTPTLTGLGERSHLHSGAINASTHVRDIVNVLEFENLTGVVLVGHSYGGLIVTAVADAVPERISALVYLDAYVGADGVSTFDLDLPEATAALTQLALSNGGHTIPPVPSAAFGVNAADQAWVDAMCRPISHACLAERLRLTGAYKAITRRTHVCATNWTGSPFGAIQKRLASEGGWTLHQLPCGHDVMVDMPKETAAIIEAAAQA